MLLRPAPIAGIFVVAGLFSPVLIWNAQHDWVSFLFQGGRARLDEGLRFERLLVMLGGQALYLMPWIWYPLIAEGVKAFRSGRRNPATWFCLCVGLPPIVLMSLIPVWGTRGFPHWTAVGYVFLFPLLGLAVATQMDGPKGRLIRNWVRFSVAIFPVIVILLATHASTGWAAPFLSPAMIAGDPTRDTISWKPLEAHLPTFELGPGAVLGAVRWYEGGKLGHALGRDRPMLLFSHDPRHFRYTVDRGQCVGRDVLFVGRPSSRLHELPQRLDEYFDGFGPVRRIEIPRRVGPAFLLDVTVGRRLLAPYPAEPREASGPISIEGAKAYPPVKFVPLDPDPETKNGDASKRLHRLEVP